MTPEESRRREQEELDRWLRESASKYQQQNPTTQPTAAPTTTPSTAASEAETTPLPVAPSETNAPLPSVTTESTTAESEITQPQASSQAGAVRYLGSEEVSAQAYTIIDLNTGEAIAGENGDLPLSMSGFVRLMTLKVVLESPDYNPLEIVTIPESARAEELFYAGEEISTEAALFAMLFGNSNDAAQALAEAYGPGQAAFVERMNAEASKLQLNSVSFSDATGESASTLITANELARLVKDLMKLPEFKAIYEAQAYLMPQSSQREVAGLVKLENPAQEVDLMSSDFLTQLKGIMLTENNDAWSYGLAAARTTANQDILAVVFGASTERPEITGVKRAAYALRSYLEEGAKGAGAQPRQFLSVLQAKPVDEEPEPSIEESTEAVTTVETTVETSTAPTEIETTAAALKPQGPKAILKILFYVLGALLALALIALIIATVMQRRRAREEEEMERMRRQQRPPRPMPRGRGGERGPQYGGQGRPYPNGQRAQAGRPDRARRPQQGRANAPRPVEQEVEVYDELDLPTE